MKSPLSMISRIFSKKDDQLVRKIPSILPDNSTNNPIFLECGPKKTPVIFLKNNHQQRVLLDPADYFITVHFMECLDWEEHLDEIYKESLRKGGHYIDIGANIGLHVLRAYRLGADLITAFEPNPNTFQVLKMNTELNGIKCDIVECALSNKIGSANFSASDVSAGMAHISNDSNHLMTVETRTLNSYFENKDISKLSLVKIDVESHEGEVIEGSIKYLKQQKNFNMIIEFGSESSIIGVNELSRNFVFDSWCYRWMKKPIKVDMDWINDPQKREGCDLVLKNLR